MLFRMSCLVGLIGCVGFVLAVSFGVDLRFWVDQNGIVPASDIANVDLPSSLRHMAFGFGAAACYIFARGLISGDIKSVSKVFTVRHFTRFSGRFLD